VHSETALKLSPENLFSSEHKNNLKWEILETKGQTIVPENNFLVLLKH